MTIHLPQTCLNCPYLADLRRALIQNEIELTKEKLLEALSVIENCEKKEVSVDTSSVNGTESSDVVSSCDASSPSA